MEREEFGQMGWKFSYEFDNEMHFEKGEVWKDDGQGSFLSVKNNDKYSIPIYENGVITEWTIDGIIGDEKYFKLLKYGDGKNLPGMVNVVLKK